MKSEKLKTAGLPGHRLGSLDSRTLYLADTKQHLNGGVIIVGTPPPLDNVKIENDNRFVIEYDLFEENALIDPDGTKHEQCEGILWPEQIEDHKGWTLCIETKYTKNATSARNPLNRYPQKMISQLSSTVFWFRDQGYLDDRKVYCVPSFPTVPEVASMSALFSLPQTRFLVNGESLSNMEIADKYRILIRYATKIHIKTDKRIFFQS
jgi:hypothetical protein